MLPHNTLGRKQGMKLFVYAGDKHPHAAQNPVEMKVKGVRWKIMANVQYRGTGRRKSSVARVILTPGTGNFVINGKEAREYLASDVLNMIVNQPLELTNTKDKFDVTVNVYGGGYSGQAGAIRHGVARALLQAGDDYRPTLKAAGFLTRDSRVKEQ